MSHPDLGRGFKPMRHAGATLARLHRLAKRDGRQSPIITYRCLTPITAINHLVDGGAAGASRS
jgi:hypothetical protein